MAAAGRTAIGSMRLRPMRCRTPKKADLLPFVAGGCGRSGHRGLQVCACGVPCGARVRAGPDQTTTNHSVSTTCEGPCRAAATAPARSRGPYDPSRPQQHPQEG